MFSRLLLCLVCFLIDRNDSRQLNINRTMATKVISSIAVCWDFPNTFSDVKRRKQIPNRFDEVFKMCGDLSILIIEKFDDVSYQYFCSAFLFVDCIQHERSILLLKLKGFHMIFFTRPYC
jgi:hypothetical protein